MMKTISLFAILIALALGVSGCGLFGHHHRAAVNPDQSGAIITPDSSLEAKVVSVNAVARFVVLNFPPNQMPKIGQSLFIYHEGLKVAEVKVTGPQQESNIVADLVSGEAKAGDTVREE